MEMLTDPQWWPELPCSAKVNLVNCILESNSARPIRFINLSVSFNGVCMCSYVERYTVFVCTDAIM